jgi:hypothetical protein
VIEWIIVVSHHLRSLLGAMELIILCEFINKVGYFDAQIRETLLYKQGLLFVYSPLWKNVTTYLHEKKIMKQLAFLVDFSTSYIKNIAQILNHFFYAFLPYGSHPKCGVPWSLKSHGLIRPLV